MFVPVVMFTIDVLKLWLDEVEHYVGYIQPEKNDVLLNYVLKDTLT